MDPHVSAWLSTLEEEEELSIGEKTHITPTLLPVWSLYTDCVSLLSKQQVNLARSSFPQGIISNLRDELIKLKLWGVGYNGGQIEGLLDQFLELKETSISILLRIGNLLTHRIYAFLDLSDSTPRRTDLIQETRKLQLQSELFSQCKPPKTPDSSLVFPVHSEHNSPAPSGVLPRNLESLIQPESKISSPSDSSISYEDRLEHDFDDILLELSVYTTALLDLLPSIAHSLAIPARTEKKDVNQFTVKIMDKYGEENKILKQRRGDANMKRYDRLLRMVREPAEITTSKDGGALLPPSRIDSGFYSGTKSTATPPCNPHQELSSPISEEQSLSPTARTTYHELPSPSSKQYKCTCGYEPKGKDINKPSNFKRHKTTRNCRRHSPYHRNDSIKPFKCNYQGCTKSYTRSDNLKAHQRNKKHIYLAELECEFLHAVATRANNQRSSQSPPFRTMQQGFSGGNL
ncbi:hypothetical protein B0J14DRAFT_659463 [Halenospora varia]|nr:hypothetical protein B0J14DRAFT_659463 [Halenospora varia]